MEPKIITRAEAKEQGLTHYYEGLTCKSGHKSKRYVKNSCCWDCASLRSKQYAKDNPEKIRKMIRKKNLENRYGLSSDNFDLLMSQQKEVCAVCNEKCIRSSTKNLCVDHCHKTGKVRGLLCSRCNSALGNLRDSPIIIQSLLSYIIKHTGT